MTVECETLPELETAGAIGALDALVARFFKAFDNTAAPADLEVLYGMMLPETIIVNNTAQLPTSYTPATFIPPRQEMLADGTLENFREWEIAAETTVFGSVAHRRSLYGKSGTVGGERVDCRGHKSFQFVCVGENWKISALSWWDEAS